MSAHARQEAILAALPADGSYIGFAEVAERVGGDDAYAVLRDLERAGRAVLTHGRGWRRAGDEPADAAFADRYLDRVAEIVARSGHMVQAVFPTAADGDGTSGFAYTVGLLDRVGAELVITGSLRPEVLQGLLNSAADLDPFPAARGVPVARIMQAPYTAVLLDTTAGRCAAAGYPLAVADRWRERNGVAAGDFPVVQIAWPDSGYRYPWSEHFDYHGRGGQVLLADPPPRP